MMMKTRHMDCYTWRDHRIPLTFYFGEVSEQASYAHPLGRRFAVLASLEGPLRSFASSVLRFAYAARVRLPIPRIPRSVAAVSSKPPYLRGEPAAPDAATGICLSIYFRFGPFIAIVD